LKPKDLSCYIDQFDLNLNGLSVYTEAASGAYLLCPILAALGGAERVYAQTKDSRFGLASDIREATMSAARKYGVADRIEVITQRCYQSLSKSDIVTNSGFVRPIDSDLIGSLKSTAVIPLMWETWEFRSSDFDLNCCKEKEILVLGTNEHEEPCDMRLFMGLFTMKLLFDLSFDGGKVLLLGNAPIPSGAIVNYLRRCGIQVTWFSEESDGDYKYKELEEYFLSKGEEYDIMILAEYKHKLPLLGDKGVLNYTSIKEVNPSLKIGVISGNIDILGLKSSGLQHLPEHIAPFGFTSYQPYMMGSRPVLTLYAAGLKVGESMAKARLRGYSTKESAAEAIISSPAMDFFGDLSWL
jgi:hypothetical protein